MSQNLRPQSKKIALAFAVLLGFGLLASYYYLQAQARQAAAALLDLQLHAQRLAHLQATQPIPVSLSLPLTTVIEQSALRHQLALVSMEPQDDEINVALPPLPFDQLIVWLGALQREHDIRVQTLAVTALPSPGEIRVDTLRLQRLFSQ